MTDTYELPELPPYPCLPKYSEDRGRWNAWAQEYARAAIQKERQRCAKIAHAELPSVTAERLPPLQQPDQGEDQRAADHLQGRQDEPHRGLSAS